jgi:hypothetical protein
MQILLLLGCFAGLMRSKGRPGCRRYRGLSDLEVERQMDAIGLWVKRGTIQDAILIEANPGPFKKPHGKDANTSRSRDGTIAKKGNEFHFGYKLH